MARKAAAAIQFNVTAKTVAKWVKRFRAEGVEGLRDRSSLPSQRVAYAAQTPKLRGNPGADRRSLGESSPCFSLERTRSDLGKIVRKGKRRGEDAETAAASRKCKSSCCLAPPYPETVAYRHRQPEPSLAKLMSLFPSASRTVWGHSNRRGLRCILELEKIEISGFMIDGRSD